MKRIFFLSIYLVFISIGLAQNPTNLSGRKAPNFSLDNINGSVTELKPLIGAPILISFWATWCKPCMEELAEYQKIYEEYKNKGLQFIAISTDDEKTTGKVKQFVKTKKFSFTVLTDPNGEVKRKYFCPEVPFSVLIDKAGTIVYSHLGYKKGDELVMKKKIQALLP